MQGVPSFNWVGGRVILGKMLRTIKALSNWFLNTFVFNFNIVEYFKPKSESNFLGEKGNTSVRSSPVYTSILPYSCFKLK